MLFLVLALAPAVPQVPADWIDPLLDGARALERGELDGARTSLERVQELLPGHGASAYLLACAAARAGEADAALAWLARSAEARPLDAAQLAWDPWLEALRDDARFASLVESARVVDVSPRKLRDELVGTEVSAISATAAGDLVVSRTGARLLDARSGELVAGLLRPHERAYDAILDPLGRWVAVAGERPRAGGTSHATFLRVHDAATGDLVRELGEPRRRVTLGTSADGHLLLSRGDGSTRLFDTDGWTELEPAPPPCDSALLSPDGARLALVTRSVVARRERRSGVALWDVRAQRMLAEHFDQADGSLPAMRFDDAGRRLALVDRSARRTRIFDARTGALERELRSIEPPLSACFLDEPGTLAVVELAGTPVLAEQAAELVAFDLATGAREPLLALPERAWTLHDAAPDALLFGAWAGGPLALVDPIARRIRWTRALGGRRGVEDAQLVAAGREVLCARGGALERLDGATGELLARAGGEPLAVQLAVSRSSATAWLGCADGSLREVDLASGRAVRVLPLSGARIESLDLGADGSLVAALDERGTLYVVDAASGELLSTRAAAVPEPSPWPGPRVDVAPSGARALLVDPRGALELVELPSGRPLATLDQETGAAFWCWSDDGDRFALREGGPLELHVRAARDGAPIGPPLRLEDPFEVIAFEPSGERLWVGTDASYVAVIELASGALARKLDHQDLDFLDTVEMASISFSPDGRLAVTASRGFGVVAAWDVASGERRWSYEYSGGNPSPLWTAFGPAGERVHVWGQGAWSPRVVDARDGSTVLDLADRGIWRLAPVPGSDLVLATGARGLESIDEHGQTRWSRIELEEGGYLLRGARGHVDGTRAALEAMHQQLADRSLPLDALASTLLDPAKVRAAAAGVALAPVELPELPTLAWREPPPRLVELGAEAEQVELTLEARSPSGLVGFEQLADGERTFLTGEATTPGARTLHLELPRPVDGHELEYRWRALAIDGTASRALRLRVAAR